MEYQAIRYAVVDGIASITLNRPERRNALDLAMRNELARAVGEIRRDKDVRAVIVAGAGNSFCAGGDLASMQGAIPDAAAGRDRLRSNIDWLQEWVMLDRPVIAAVDGHAAGAGFNLALAADFILATPEARFAQSFARVGLVPDFAGLHLLPRIVGLQRAKELVFSARTIDAAEAHALGIVYEIHGREALQQAALTLAARIATASPDAFSLAKQALNQAQAQDLRANLEIEAAYQGICFTSDFHKEAVRRFLAKEPALFAGLA
jgi:2-(1,2-epoxy-1,2-dihydrophenyl)acetyl-CoA isomerase